VEMKKLVYLQRSPYEKDNSVYLSVLYEKKEKGISF
jgi:hypothetical protein